MSGGVLKEEPESAFVTLFMGYGLILRRKVILSFQGANKGSWVDKIEENTVIKCVKCDKMWCDCW